MRFLGQIVMEIRALTSRNLHCGYKGSRVSRQVRDSVIGAVTGPQRRAAPSRLGRWGGFFRGLGPELSLARSLFKIVFDAVK